MPNPNILIYQTQDGITKIEAKLTNHYNLDVIISVAYRVKSLQGTKFRQWATARLNEYIVKGFIKQLNLAVEK